MIRLVKPFRTVHTLAGILATIPVLLIVAAVVLLPFQKTESAYIGELQTCVERKVEAYRRATGSYPGSLQALSFTNTPQEIAARPYLKKMAYSREERSYELSYKGLWYHYALSVSNHGAASQRGRR